MKKDLRSEALEMLRTDDDLFVEMVNELDSWNGYADGFRCYPMWELDELFGDCKVSDFLDKITSSFDHNDEYMIDTIYGLDSTNDCASVYRNNIDEDYFLDDLIENKNHLYFSDSEFEELLNQIESGEEDEEIEETEESAA